jgi:hypothetical protein
MTRSTRINRKPTSAVLPLSPGRAAEIAEAFGPPSPELIRNIADGYVRSHFSLRGARMIAADDDLRFAAMDEVAAYLGDHPLLDEVAYAELCDVAAEAVAARAEA